MPQDYPNRNRTKEERKARYCFLRHLGFCRNMTRGMVGLSDKRMILAIEYNSGFREEECIDNRKNKKIA